MGEDNGVLLKDKELEEMTYEELEERQKRLVDLLKSYKFALANTIVEYETQKNTYIDCINETGQELIKVQDLFWSKQIKQPHTNKER